MDDTGDRIMDYSMVGYQGGLVPLPDYSTLGIPTINVSPIAGDNLTNVQNAINQAAGLSLQTSGFRAVVQLAAGTYDISAGLTINSSGIILRGVGNGSDPATNTILAYTGTSQIDMIHVDNGSNGGRSTNTTHNVVDKVVPSGATSFTVDSTSGYSVGDKIVVHRPSTANWIHDIEMDTLTNPWTAGSKNQDYERTITYIDQTRKRIFFDAGIPNSLDQQYGGGTVSKYTFNRTTNVGIENIRGDGQAVLTTPDDENHANSFVVMQDTADSWARNITGQHLVYATMEAGTGSKNITLDGASSVDPISQITGGRRYPFNIEGQYVLMKNMTSDQGRHEFVNNSPSRGPNVFLDGTATGGHADSGPHQRWSTGTLWDNITTNTDINLQNRGNWGTGHGWAGANMVIWNSKASDFYVQNPETAQNWLIGSTGTVHSTSQNWPGSYPAYYDANNVGSQVTLNGETSLYRAQLNQRTSHQRETQLEYWVGDFDNYVNDGASDSVPVDSQWLSQVKAIAPSLPVVGFDNGSTGAVMVPFTFNFDVPGSQRVRYATLTMAVKNIGSLDAGDRLYIDSTSSSVALSQLLALPHFGNSDIVTLEFAPDATSDSLGFLQDGKLNLMLNQGRDIDWADLRFTVGGAELIWTGSANSTWDVQTTQNWNDGAASQKFFNGDYLTFGNGPTNRNVVISGTVFPGGVTINNSTGNDYTIGGGVIAGAATITKTGTGTLTLTGANTYTGQTLVAGGILKVGNLAALGTATAASDGTYVSGGGTLDVNGFALGTRQERVFIAGAGVNGGGALVNTGADQINATRFVTLAADASVGGTGRLDVRGSSSSKNPPDGLLDLAGYALTKTGANKLAIVSTLVTNGNIVVNQGTLSIETTSLVQGSGTITLNAGTTLQLWDNPAGNVTRNMVFNGITVDNQNRTSEIIDSNITFGGNNNFSVGSAAANTLKLDGVLSETGGPRTLAKTGAGILALAGANTFTGNTKISGGVLRLDHSLALQLSALDYGNYGGTLSFGSLASATLGGLQGSQSLALTNASAGNVTLSVGGNGGDTTYSGVLSGGGSLVKIGAGTLTLSGTNLYFGATQINQGTLLLNGNNRLSSVTSVVLAGGRLATAGYNETLGTLNVSADSALDLGNGHSTVRFANSGATAWSGLLSIANWDGDWRNGNGVDQVLFGSSTTGLTASQLSEIQFAGFPRGAAILSTGEAIPSSAPNPLAGDLDQNAHVTAADISAMTRALVDLDDYQATNQLLDPDLKTIADVNLDGGIDNLDLQALIVRLATLAGGGGSSATAVPEPPAIMCAAWALLAVWVNFLREIRGFPPSLGDR
jgi:autotransporter-associated beta strand protein